jgi:hypothetical protein
MCGICPALADRLLSNGRLFTDPSGHWRVIADSPPKLQSARVSGSDSEG